MLTVKDQLLSVAEQLDPARWKGTDMWQVNLQDIGIDSIAYIHFIVAVEQQLQIEMPDELLDFGKFQTLEEIGNYIERLTA
ncbi:hypothetical protein PA598K_02991 [Paenibacillus sp. 598K]|uniref:acyl carrier protein n=1 Tax=Paenibacillus sp. 598K TaxID=1117987 RepID=UPI000FFAEFF2|nr:acyl carrier protein [Paenibacillus sp. 598K]GBF74634.1 hypothetical protein PA598K_02991 [Paenibacillus sp. 598K]